MFTRLIQIFSVNHPHQFKSPSITPDKTPMGFDPHFPTGNKMFAPSFCPLLHLHQRSGSWELST